MTYLIPIFLTLAVLFGTSVGSHLPGIKQVQGSIIDSLFPKNEKEILIDNVNKQYDTISKFFSAPTAAALLTSKTLTDQQKADLKSAIDTVASAKQNLDSLTIKEKADQNIVKSIVQRVLNLDDNQAAPTSLPPACRVVCDK